MSRRPADRAVARRGWRRAGLLAAALLAGCGSTTELELALTGDPNCTALRLAPVSHVSVQVWGLGDDGQPCQLARRCLTLDDRPTSIEDVAAALGAATQPLVDLEAEGALQVAVIGHRTQGCGAGDQDLCGVADLADAADGRLAVDVVCERTLMDDRCGADSLPLCP